MNKTKAINYDKMNYGFSLLKMLLAFEVVLGHFCNWKEYDTLLLWPFRELVSLAVPSFVIISFYLMERSILSRNDEKYKTRLIKLLIPQVGWAFIYWFVYLMCSVLFSKDLPHSFTDLLWQIFTGHSTTLNATMWYQVDIIVLTIIYYSIFRKLDDRKGYIAIVILTLFAYFMQYSLINYNLFKDLRFELKYPLGRIIEMIPYATIGFSFKYFNILEKIKKYWYLAIPVSAFMFLQGFKIAWYDVKDFGFAGICKPYLAIWIVIAAFSVPLEILPLTLKKIILQVTNYTLGIYCCHRMINTLLDAFVPNLPLMSFERCILIYIISYILCYLISLIPNKNIESLIN